MECVYLNKCLLDTSIRQTHFPGMMGIKCCQRLTEVGWAPQNNPQREFTRVFLARPCNIIEKPIRSLNKQTLCDSGEITLFKLEDTSRTRLDVGGHVLWPVGVRKRREKRERETRNTGCYEETNNSDMLLMIKAPVKQNKNNNNSIESDESQHKCRTST